VQESGVAVTEFAEKTIDQISETAPVVVDSVEEVLGEIGTNTEIAWNWTGDRCCEGTEEVVQFWENRIN